MRAGFLLILSGVLAGCWNDDDAPDLKIPEHFTGTKGHVVYTYRHLPSEPINVYYNIPDAGDKTRMPILFVLHGTNRTASNYRDAWVESSDSKGFMVFAPEFPDKGSFGGSAGYNQGGMYTGSVLKPEEKWTFPVIEDLFDFIVEDLGGSQSRYDMWGHSAGGQFTHRYVLFMPEARIDRAVAANAGWYTVPDLAVDFPYGLKGSPASAATLVESFTRKLYIELGTADTDPTDPDVLHNTEADKQGLHRYERGLYFYSAAQDKSAGTVFNWNKVEVPGVAHDFRQMAREAVKILY